MKCESISVKTETLSIFAYKNNVIAVLTTNYLIYDFDVTSFHNFKKIRLL